MSLNVQGKNLNYLLMMAVLLFSGAMVSTVQAMGDMSGGGGMGSHHPSPPPVTGPLPPFSASAASFAMDGVSKAGETVTFILEVATSGAGSRPIPWAIFLHDRMNGTTKAIAAKITPDVPAGSSLTEKITWKALPGYFEFYAYVDPQQSLGETLEEQADNRSKTLNRQFSDWMGWSEAFRPEIQSAIKRWIADATIGGQQTLPDKIAPVLSLSPLLPGYVADGVMNAVSDAWMKWAGSIEVPDTTAKGPVALASLRQSPLSLEPSQLAASIKSQVGPASGWEGGEAAIENISGSIHSMFKEWRQRAVVVSKGSGRYRFDGVFGE